MKKKRIKSVVLIVGILVIISFSCAMYFLPARGIDITLSTVVERAEINDPVHNYNYYLYYNAGHYDDENYDYEYESGYDVYNCYLKVDNSSNYDIYNIYINDFSNASYHMDKYDKFDPYLIEAGESEFIALTILIKNDLDNSEVSDIINNISSSVTVCLVRPEDENAVNYNSKLITKYDKTDEDYSDEDIRYPNLL